jgi:cytochrome d ubiquinol oxidase subunit II
MTLGTTWFIIVAIFWCGFFVLDGFDFGVGMLHSFIGRNDLERRILVNTIGPFWDGNEVWLVVAGAAMFAAFPGWYGTMFSAFYLALLIVLVGLMGRGVSFEYQRKVDNPRWRGAWRWALTIGSALVPLLLGVALGDLLHGLPINSSHDYTGTFWDLLTGYGIWTGLTLLVLSLFMGATFLTLKTTGELQDRAHRAATWIGLLAILVLLGFVIWTHVGLSTGFLPEPIEVLAFIAIVGGAWAASVQADGWAFAAGAIAIAATVGSIFNELYSRVMISSTNTANNLTVANSASPSYTLKVMTVVAAIFFPIVLVYQIWSYYIFRNRLRAPRVGGVQPANGSRIASEPRLTSEAMGAPSADDPI